MCVCIYKKNGYCITISASAFGLLKQFCVPSARSHDLFMNLTVLWLQTTYDCLKLLYGSRGKNISMYVC
jgi:hypothetical protein